MNSYVKAFESYHLTDRETRPKLCTGGQISIQLQTDEETTKSL